MNNLELVPLMTFPAPKPMDVGADVQAEKSNKR